ncbi:c-type cytochrome [Methylobacterium mesophilicum]|uniref:c-type cytochrome n=1 Tax=Methylobacterium mesophilicum TaxID=39956 RepID=UPI002F31D304
MRSSGWSSRITLAGLMMSLVAGPTRAADGGDIAGNGTQAGAPACASCHGDRGGGSAADGFPRLAGLARGYLVHELDSFVDGTRQNEIMSPIAQALTPGERRAVAAFYAALPASKVAAETSIPDTTVMARGKALAETGAWSKGLPACAQCHGPGGQGVGPAFPALAGQPAAYLRSQLSAWKAGTRHNDPLGLMKGIAAKLGEDDGAAAAAYYAALPASPVGGRP